MKRATLFLSTSTSSSTSASPVSSEIKPAMVRPSPPSDMPPLTLTPIPLSPVSTVSTVSTASTISIPTFTLSPPKRSRSPVPARSLALEVLLEDIADHNASTSRSSPLLASPLPAPSTVLAAPFSDAALVCAAYYLATLDARVPVTSDNASALLISCLGAGALASERGAAGKAVEGIALAAGIECWEVREYAEIARIYVPRAPGVGEYRVYDELLRGMVEGLY